MTAPPDKPWENQTHLRNVGYPGDFTEHAVSQTRRMLQAQAPPLPARMARHHSGPRSLGGGVFPSYGMYGGYGGWPGTMMGSYGRYPEFENRFVQMAEESSQPAFESIESFVRAFSSITMMMESTFQAMTMSFRAVLSVAENMSRLKGVLMELFTAFAIFRKIRWFLKRILYNLGLIRGLPLGEESWKEAETMMLNSATSAIKSEIRKKPSLLPLFTFFGIMLGGPYLLYRLLGCTVGEEKTTWDPANDGIQVVALYDFYTTYPGEIAFRKGELLWVKPSKRNQPEGWVLASKNGKIGYIPSDRVVPLKREMVAPKMEKGVHPIATTVVVKAVPVEQPLPPPEVQNQEEIKESKNMENK